MVPRLRSGRLRAHGSAGVLGEYDGNNNLLRKYIYGPGIDQPVSMIEVADNNAAYYYHYDALGSVIALSDSAGDTVQTYEYSVFGEPAVEDPNHTNPYMFAGRRYDAEIGLYYNRARYYNPYTGRYLQADPIGYSDGMNIYSYCRNNSTNWVDPKGNTRVLPTINPWALIQDEVNGTIGAVTGAVEGALDFGESVGDTVGYVALSAWDAAALWIDSPIGREALEAVDGMAFVMGGIGLMCLPELTVSKASGAVMFMSGWQQMSIGVANVIALACGADEDDLLTRYTVPTILAQFCFGEDVANYIEIAEQAALSFQKSGLQFWVRRKELARSTKIVYEILKKVDVGVDGWKLIATIDGGSEYSEEQDQANWTFIDPTDTPAVDPRTGLPWGMEQ